MAARAVRDVAVRADDKAHIVYIRVGDGRIHHTRPLDERIGVDFDAEGSIVGIRVSGAVFTGAAVTSWGARGRGRQVTDWMHGAPET